MSAVSSKPAGAACLECPLKDAPCVPSEQEHPRPKLAIVGEAPGGTEIAEGRPFVGASGRLLNKSLGRIGLKREDILWTNAVLCAARDTTDLHKAAKQCRERLHQEIAQAEHVVPVGAYALQSVLRLSKRPKILEWRGFVIKRQNQLVMPTVHPAFVLRAPLWADVVSSDFERIDRLRRSGWLPPERTHGRKRLLAKNIAALKALLDEKMGRVVAVDVETTEEPAMFNKLLCLSITSEDALRTVVIPWSVELTGEGKYFGEEQETAAALISEFLADRISVTHNGPNFDHIVLERYGIFIGPWEDTLVAHHALAGHMPQRLSHVVSMYLDAPPWKEKKHTTARELYQYNAQDTLYTILGWHGMQEDLAAERHVYEVDCRSAELCRDMQIVGMRFDHVRAQLIRKRLTERLSEIEREVEESVGFRIPMKGKGSIKELRHAIFTVLEAPVLIRSEKGKHLPSLDVNVLRQYATYADERLRVLANSVLDHRKARKAITTYIDPIITDLDSRVHPSWSVTVITGRWACRRPALMTLHKPHNDPARDVGGIRSMYVASPGHALCAFDCKQLEMRVAAYVSGDDVMIAACETTDLHSANAELLWADAFRNGTKEERAQFRDIAKQSGFAVAYMARAETVHARIVASGLPMSLAMVESMLQKMRRTFWRYYQFQDKMLHQTMRLGYIATPLLGRKRWMGFNPSPQEAGNYSVQGGAADFMNIKLPKVVDALPPDVKLIAQIHDAGMFDVPNRLVDETKAIIKEIVETPIEVKGRKVVFPIDLKVGERWSEL